MCQLQNVSVEVYFHNLFPLVFPFRYWRWGWTCSKLELITESCLAPNLFIDTSRCRPFTEDSSRASSAWSRMQVWSVQFIRWDRTTVKHYICGCEEDAFIKCFVLWFQSIMSWAKNDPAYNSDSKLFLFSFVAFASGQMTSYPLAVIRTQQQAQGKPLHFPWTIIF